MKGYSLECLELHDAQVLLSRIDALRPKILVAEPRAFGRAVPASTRWRPGQGRPHEGGRPRRGVRPGGAQRDMPRLDGLIFGIKGDLVAKGSPPKRGSHYTGGHAGTATSHPGSRYQIWKGTIPTISMEPLQQDVQGGQLTKTWVKINLKASNMT